MGRAGTFARRTFLVASASVVGGVSEGVPFAPTDEGLLANSARSFMQVPAKFLGLQLTGGSSSVPDAYEKHRLAGAVARESLKQAAADAWGVAVAEVSTQAGSVLHADGRRLAYPELASAAASLELSEEPQLKAPKDWSLWQPIPGTPCKR